jgi:hypothetical protein
MSHSALKKHLSFRAIIWCSFTLFGIFSCAKKTAFQSKAPSENSKQFTFRPEVSDIHLPLQIPVSILEDSINAQLKGLLYEANDIQAADLVTLELKVWKQDKITLEVKGNEAFYKVPLKIWTNVHLIASIMGIDIRESKETECALELLFKSKLGVDSLWNIQTSTSLQNYRWLSPPVLHVGSFELPLAFLADFLLKSQQKVLSSQIDEQVKNNLPLKPLLESIWGQLQDPIKISDNPSIVLYIKPIAPYLTPIVGNGGHIGATVGITALVESQVGTQPAVKKIALPLLQTHHTPSDQCTVSWVNTIPYQTATDISKKELKGKRFTFDEGKKEVTILDVDLYPHDDKMVIKTTLEGSLNGIVYLKGIPVFDSSTQEILLTKTEFDLDTKDKLQKTASWLLHGVFERKMEPYLRYSLAGTLKESEESIRQALTNNRLSPTLVLNGKLNQLQPKQIVLSAEGIKTVVNATGVLNLKWEGF